MPRSPPGSADLLRTAKRAGRRQPATRSTTQVWRPKTPLKKHDQTLAAAKPALTVPAMRTYHLTWATAGRQPAFPAEAVRRAVLRAIAEVAGAFVVLFAIVDDHVHIIIVVEPDKLWVVQRALTMVLGNRSAVPLAPCFVKPVETRKHSEHLVKYCLTQNQHHGVGGHAATDTGSCFLDLVGARRIPKLNMPILRALPRFRLREVYAHVGLPQVELAPGDDGMIRALGMVRFAELAAEALCVGPGLGGNRAEVANARAVIAVIGAAAGFRADDIGHALGVVPAAARRLIARAVDAADVRAVRMRVALDVAVRQIPEVGSVDFDALLLGEGPVAMYDGVAERRGRPALDDAPAYM